MGASRPRRAATRSSPGSSVLNHNRRGRRTGSPDTRAEILAVARRRLLADGYHGLTMRAVAAEAGVDASTPAPNTIAPSRAASIKACMLLSHA